MRTYVQLDSNNWCRVPVTKLPLKIVDGKERMGGRRSVRGGRWGWDGEAEEEEGNSPHEHEN